MCNSFIASHVNLIILDNFSKSENLIAGTIFDEYKSDNQEENGKQRN